MNITFEIDALNKNKQVTGNEEIAEKIYSILNSRGSNYPFLDELPKLYDNFRKNYITESEIENEIYTALLKFIDPDISINQVLFNGQTNVLAIYFNDQENPLLYSAVEDRGLQILNF